MRALKITGISLLTVLLLIVALISYITMTHGGMQRLFSLGASYVQGELHWNELQGSLIGPAEINGFQYDGDDGTAVRINDIKFDWSPRRLLKRNIYVEYLSAQGIEVRLPEPAVVKDNDTTEPFQLEDLRLPVGAEIKQLSLSDIKVYTYGSDVPVVIDRIVFGGSGKQSDLQVVELTASVPNGAIKVDGVVNTTGSWPMSLTTVWQFEDERLGPLEGRAVASGDLDELSVDHKLLGAIESIADIKVNNVTGELTLSGTATVTADDLGILSPAAAGMPLALKANLSGSLNDLNVDANVTSEHETSGPFTVDVNAHTDQMIVQLRQVDVTFDNSAAVIATSGDVDLQTQQADLDLQWSGFAWPLRQDNQTRDRQVRERQPQERQIQDVQQAPLLINDSSGMLKVQANAKGVRVTGDAIVDQNQSGRMDIVIDVAADPEQVLINSLTAGGVDSDSSLNLAGVFSIPDNRVDLQGDWENLRWPLNGNTADYESRAGQFGVVGPLSEYRLELSLEAGGAKVPDGKWQVSGIGSDRAFSELQVTGDTLDGRIEAKGTAGWTPQPEWDFVINARGINPESQWPGFDARVDVAVKSSGIVTAEGLSQSTDIIDIGGTYKGQPLAGAGGVAVVDGELVVDNLSLSAGAAKITASGTVGNEVNLQWQVEAPSLEALVPGFKGELQINGDHTGGADTMGSQIEIQSAQIDSEFLKVSDLDGTAIVDLSGGKDSEIEIRASGITLNGQQWDSLSINGNGTPESHDIDVRLDGAMGKFNLRADGAYSDTRWSGMVTDLRALATVLGDWTLERPVRLVAGNEVQFSDLCIRSDASSVCTDLSRTADGAVAAEAVLQDFDVSRFREFLPADIGIDVDINGSVKLEIDKHGQLRVAADAGFPDGILRYQDQGAPVQQDLGQSSFTARINGNTVDTAVDIDLAELGFIRLGAEITEPGKSNLTRVNGKFNSEINDLSVIGIFVPELESVTGVFTSNVAFNGSIDTPRITGRASIDDLSLEVPSVALEVTDGSLQVSGNGRGGLLFRGAAQSGKGQLDLDGNYNASTGDLNLGVAGENFLVSNTSRQRVEVSPDLNIRFADRQLSVSGELLVPTALVKTGGGTTVIVESPDVVIVDSSVVPVEKKQSEIDLDVQVTLGDDIRIDAGQFDGALSGGLRVNKKPGQVITASGAIEVISGDFLVYGQKLTMESGKILFSGGPIDDPVLDLDVARDVAEFSVKAGVRVTGTAQTPILELQSDPPQTDANTLSYILLGKPIEALGASYTLGRFITPELYVSFGFDLFDRREIFTLRYQLSDRLSLIGSSSRSREPSSGADLIYTLER